MIYLLALFILVSGYYTLTYGLTLYRDEKNLLAGGAVIAVAVIGTISPLAFLFIKQL